MRNFLKIKFLQPQEVLKAYIFGLTMSPIISCRRPKLRKVIIFTEKNPLGNPKTLKGRPYLLSISNEKYSYVLWYLGILSPNGLVVKDREVRGQVNSTLLEGP